MCFLSDFVPDFSAYLNSLFEYIKKVLGAKVCVYMHSDLFFDRYNIIFDPINEHSHTCRYCRAVQDADSNFSCANQEKDSDIKLVLNSKKPVIRKCFAGVFDALIPVFLSGEFCGVIKLGQVRNLNEESIEFTRFKSDSLLVKWYNDLPKVDLKTLEYSANLIDYALNVFDWENYVLDDNFNEFNITAINAKNIIDSYIWKKDFSVTSVAVELGITPEHLSRIFMKKYNKSITCYLSEMKIKRAKFLLKNTSSSILKISDKCGFADPNYFSRFFKKYVGISPSKYRKNF